MYCKINGELTTLNQNCGRPNSRVNKLCGGWKYFTANCPKWNTSCSGLSGGWVPAITVCNQKLFSPVKKEPFVKYSQSSVYEDSETDRNVPANAINMRNGIYDERFATGTDYPLEGLAYIQMKFNKIYFIKRVVVGCDWFGPKPNWDPNEPGLGGSWGKTYTENVDIEYSLDGINWTFLTNTGEFTQPIQSYPANVRARYVRLSLEDYIAATEFYAII